MEFLDYRPNPKVLARLPGVDFAAVIGPTAAGKTTLLDGAIAREPSIHMVVVTTSRAPRPGEQNEIDYHFRTEAEIRERAARGEYVQVAPKVFADLYATAPDDYSTEGISVMAVIADAMPAFSALPFKRIRQVFVLPPDWDTWQARASGHGFNSEQIAKRLREARHSLAYAVAAPEVDFIINDDLESAIESMKQFLVSGSGVVPRRQGKTLAKTLLDRLKTNTGD